MSLLQVMTMQTTSHASKRVLKAMPARTNTRTKLGGNGVGGRTKKLEVFPDS